MAKKKRADKTKTYHHGDLRQSCIRKGLEFLSKGKSEFSFRELARELGVSPGAPFKHFANKEALLVAITEEGFVQFAEALRNSKQKSEGLPPSERFRAKGVAYLEFALKNPHHYRLMFSHTIPRHEDYPSLHEKGMQAFTELTSMVEQMQKDGYFKKQNVVEQSMLIWTQVHGMVSLILEGRLGFIEEQLGTSALELHEKLGEHLLKSLQ
jgi:AcrR family transcriptional regulator